MDTIEEITQDFLRGSEQVLHAFNRLLAYKAPVVPVAMMVQAMIVREEQTGLL